MRPRGTLLGHEVGRNGAWVSGMTLDDDIRTTGHPGPTGPAAGDGDAEAGTVGRRMVAVPSEPSALARCAAVEPATFATAHWGRIPLLSREADLPNPAGFTDLFSLADADELLSRRGLRTPFLRVLQEGALVPATRYTGSGGAGAEIADQALDEQVLAQYASGATVVLQSLHRLWPPTIDFAWELGTILRQPVQVNAYVIPRGSRGFEMHYDTHDVFVLQVAGRKRWRVHEPVLPDPLKRQLWDGQADEVAAVPDGPAVLDVLLSPGDALYLPRGWLHDTEIEESDSLHLSVGIRALTRYALVDELLVLAAEDQRLRSSLPFGVDLTEPDAVKPQLTETVAVLREWLLGADPVALAGRLRARSWSVARPAPIRPLAQAAALAEVDVSTRLVPRPGLRWQLIAQDADRVILQVFDRVISFPARCRPALRAVLTGTVSRVGELPGLDHDEERIVLGRRLLREAVAMPS